MCSIVIKIMQISDNNANALNFLNEKQNINSYFWFWDWLLPNQFHEIHPCESPAFIYVYKSDAAAAVISFFVCCKYYFTVESLRFSKRLHHSSQVETVLPDASSLDDGRTQGHADGSAVKCFSMLLPNRKQLLEKNLSCISCLFSIIP